MIRSANSPERLVHLQRKSNRAFSPTESRRWPYEHVPLPQPRPPRRGRRHLPGAGRGRRRRAPSPARPRPSGPGPACRCRPGPRSSPPPARSSPPARPSSPTLVARECGKLLIEAGGDVQEAVDMARFVAGQGRGAVGRDGAVGAGLEAGWTTRIPVGVVGMITPWNFPVAIPSWKCFPALLAGNGIVLKPSEHSPACAEAFVAACVEAGVPAGLIQLVHGHAEPGRRHRHAPRHRRRQLHRLGADRPQGGGRGHGDRPAPRQPRARREERHDRARRRRSRPRGRRRDLRRVRHGGPALHLDVAAARPPGRRRRARRPDRGPGRALRLGDPLDPATDVGPVIDRALGRAHRRHGRRGASTRAPSSPAAGGSVDRRRLRRRHLRRADGPDAA